MRQEQLREQLVRLIRDGKLLHAYILEGRHTGSLNHFAGSLAHEITCYGEDVHRICADGLSVKDKAVEELLARLHLKPLVGERTVAIIQDADTMTPRAQNRLLKTLEEPPGEAVLLLLSNNAEHLLPTIRSRCVLFRLDEDGEFESAYEASSIEQAQAIGTMILKGESYYAMAGKLQEVTSEREQAYAFLDALEKWYRDLLLWRAGVPAEFKDPQIKSLGNLLHMDRGYSAVALIEEARRDLDRRINTSYAIKNMVLKMI